MIQNCPHNFQCSKKKHEIFEDSQKNLYPENPVKAASSLIEVRWSCKYDGVNTLVTRIKAGISTLSAVAAGDSNKSEIGAGIYHKCCLENSWFPCVSCTRFCPFSMD